MFRRNVQVGVGLAGFSCTRYHLAMSRDQYDEAHFLISDMLAVYKCI